VRESREIPAEQIEGEKETHHKTTIAIPRSKPKTLLREGNEQNP